MALSGTAAFVDAFLNGWPEPPSYDSLVAQAKKQGGKWTDADFPPSASSLYTRAERPPKLWPKVTEWKRVTEFGEKPQMFLDGTDPGDVIQGVLGDCWFLGALSVVATRDELIFDICLQRQLNDYGIYAFKFFKNGSWVTVYVDDWIPTHRGRPIFSRCKDANECWVSLIEKAYAKLHRAYENLEGGTETYAFVDLTGCAPDTIDLESRDVKLELSSGRLFPRLDQEQNAGHLLGCAKIVANGRAEANTGQGILQNHAYGIIDIRAVGGVQLFRVRNPWGQTEWKGAYSDGSKEWTPELKKELEYEFEEDGTFWMTMQDLAKQFNRIYLNCVFDRLPNEWSSSSFKGQWATGTAGGCGNFPSWKENPQFGLRLQAKSDVFVTLSQRDVRLEGVRAVSELSVGFVVLRAPDAAVRVPQIRQPDLLTASAFSTDREVSRYLQFGPGEFVIVPSTFYPNNFTQFLLRIFVRSPSGSTSAAFEIGSATAVRFPPIASSPPATGSVRPAAAADNSSSSLQQQQSQHHTTDNLATIHYKGLTSQADWQTKPAHHPLYVPSSSDFGRRPPNQDEVPVVYHGRKTVITQIGLKLKEGAEITRGAKKK